MKTFCRIKLIYAVQIALLGSVYMKWRFQVKDDCSTHSGQFQKPPLSLKTRAAESNSGQSYLDAVSRKVIDGWFMHGSMLFYASISTTQRAFGITGSVGEIGVHHGLGFIAAAQL